jgi:hypothetical protein
MLDNVLVPLGKFPPVTFRKRRFGEEGLINRFRYNNILDVCVKICLTQLTPEGVCVDLGVGVGSGLLGNLGL